MQFKDIENLLLYDFRLIDKDIDLNEKTYKLLLEKK